VFHTVVGLAMLPASLVGGWLWDHVSPAATFYFGAITASVTALLFVVFIVMTRIDGGSNA
jgi:predicted MFS family arabinose efflux permease